MDTNKNDAMCELTVIPVARLLRVYGAAANATITLPTT